MSDKKKPDVIIIDPESKKQTEQQKKPVTMGERMRHVVTLALFCVFALLVGIATGCLDALFGIILLKVSDIRESYPYWLIPFLPAAGLLLYFMYDRFGKETKEGMNLVFGQAQNSKTNIRLRLIPFVTLSTWITHLFGGSAGREGVAVQIGGTLGSFASRYIDKRHADAKRVMTIAGMAAGFAGAAALYA